MSDLECQREDVIASEIFDEKTMEPVAVVASWKENGKYYRTRLPAKGCDLRKPDLDGAGCREIPCIEEFWGKWDERMLEAPHHLHGASEVYIKKSQIWRYAGAATPDLFRSKSDVVAAFQRDATMYEILQNRRE